MPHIHTTGSIFLTLSLATLLNTAGGEPMNEIVCEGTYGAHLQGVAADAQRQNLYWSFTRDLLRTDASGTLLARVPVPNHHGDLAWHSGRVYVAVNLGAFNQPAGKADSWIYVYDDQSLELLATHPVKELVHGAGGIDCDGQRFIVIGGLPEGIEENYAYEYDLQLRFVARHVIPSGYTRLGIQTACWDGTRWLFGCYGNVLLTCDNQLTLQKSHTFNAAYGIIPLGADHFLVAKHIEPKWRARLDRYRYLPATGMQRQKSGAQAKP